MFSSSLILILKCFTVHQFLPQSSWSFDMWTNSISYFIAEIWWPFGPPSRAPYRKAKEAHELIFLWLLWLAVFLVNVYAMTTKKTAIMESYKMVSTLQLTSYWRRTPLVYSVILCYWTSKTKYPLTSITLLYCGLKFRAHQGHMFFKVNCLPTVGFWLDQFLFASWLESKKHKEKNWEENDFYDSDEDSFLDRTGSGQCLIHIFVIF